MGSVLRVALAVLFIINGTFGALDGDDSMEQLQEAHNRTKRAKGTASTGINEFTWVAYLETAFRVVNSLERIHLFCGGSLISDFYVLTAAHCFFKLGHKLERIQVTLPEHNKRNPSECEPSQQYPWMKCMKKLSVVAEGHVIHPHFILRTLKHDIALIRLPGRVPFSKYVQPINIPHVNIDAERFTNMPLRVIGWGTNGITYPDVKQSAVLNLIPQKQCKSAYNYYHLFPSQLCAMGHNGENACDGDSGGPLVAIDDAGQYMQVGIVSTGDTNPCSNGPSIFTNVYHYVPWIKQAMASYERRRPFNNYV